MTCFYSNSELTSSATSNKIFVTRPTSEWKISFGIVNFAILVDGSVLISIELQCVKSGTEITKKNIIISAVIVYEHFTASFYFTSCIRFSSRYILSEGSDGNVVLVFGQKFFSTETVVLHDSINSDIFRPMLVRISNFIEVDDKFFDLSILTTR